MKRKLERETVVNFLTLLLHCLEVGWQNVVSWCSGRALSPNDVIQQIENTLTCYKSASHKLKSERSELQCTRSRSDRASDEVWRSTCFVCMDLNHIINSREKKRLTVLCRERREISLTVLLVNCHDVTGRIFDRWISRQTGMKSSLKLHNQLGKK